jgi:hypothetical protein
MPEAGDSAAKVPTLRPPGPIACMSCKPDRHDLPFDPPIVSVVLSFLSGMTGVTQYYIVDIEHKRMCNFTTKSEDEDLKKGFIHYCKYHKINLYKISSIVNAANLVWLNPNDPPSISIEEDEYDGIYLFYHDKFLETNYEDMENFNHSKDDLINIIRAASQ